MRRSVHSGSGPWRRGSQKRFCRKLQFLRKSCCFGEGVKAPAANAEAERKELFEQIGRLKMELEWLKKKVAPFG